MSLNALAAFAVQQALNTSLSLDPMTQHEVQQLAGNTVSLQLQGIGLEFFLTPQANGEISVASSSEIAPGARISGAPFSLLRLSLSSKQEDALFGGDVSIAGDLELARRFSAVLRALDPDWEELLSRFGGDVLAHKLASLLRGGHQWRKHAVVSLSQDCSDYLREEARFLPGRVEVDNFLGQVDTLRQDLDRLEVRIKRMNKIMRPVRD